MNFNLYDIPSAWKGHEQFARWLIETLRPQVVVDLGVDHGFSSIVMAQPGIGKVFGIDAFTGDEHTGFRDAKAACLKNVFASGVTNLQIIHSPFDEAADSWSREIDILHIDGRHYYNDVKHDFERWRLFVRPGGVIMLHDTRSFPGDVGRFFSEISLPKFEFEHAHGLGVCLVNT